MTIIALEMKKVRWGGKWLAFSHRVGEWQSQDVYPKLPLRKCSQTWCLWPSQPPLRINDFQSSESKESLGNYQLQPIPLRDETMSHRRPNNLPVPRLKVPSNWVEIQAQGFCLWPKYFYYPGLFPRQPGSSFCRVEGWFLGPPSGKWWRRA